MRKLVCVSSCVAFSAGFGPFEGGAALRRHQWSALFALRISGKPTLRDIACARLARATAPASCSRSYLCCGTVVERSNARAVHALSCSSMTTLLSDHEALVGTANRSCSRPTTLSSASRASLEVWAKQRRPLASTLGARAV